jgi:23S rRNA maturation mini-RNase III
MLDLITPHLTEEEAEISRRARNLSIPVGRKNIQSTYRPATAFEVLIGFWYLHNKKRLENIYEIIRETGYFS